MPRPEALQATRESIKHWCIDVKRPLMKGQKIVIDDEYGRLFWSQEGGQVVDISPTACALCALYYDECYKCTIFRVRKGCCIENSPYDIFTKYPTLRNANKMIKALVEAYKHERKN